MTTEQFDALPKYAREKISNLVGKILGLKAKKEKLEKMLFIYETYADSIQFTTTDIKKLDKLSKKEKING